MMRFILTALILMTAGGQVFANELDGLSDSEEMLFFSCPAPGNFNFAYNNPSVPREMQRVCDMKSQNGEKLIYQINRQKTTDCNGNAMMRYVFTCVPKVETPAQEESAVY